MRGVQQEVSVFRTNHQSSSLRQQTLLPSREIHQGVPVKDLHEALSLLQEEHNNMVDHISYLQGKVLSLKMRHEDLREEQSRQLLELKEKLSKMVSPRQPGKQNLRGAPPSGDLLSSPDFPPASSWQQARHELLQARAALLWVASTLADGQHSIIRVIQDFFDKARGPCKEFRSVEKFVRKEIVAKIKALQSAAFAADISTLDSHVKKVLQTTDQWSQRQSDVLLEFLRTISRRCTHLAATGKEVEQQLQAIQAHRSRELEEVKTLRAQVQSSEQLFLRIIDRIVSAFPSFWSRQAQRDQEPATKVSIPMRKSPSGFQRHKPDSSTQKMIPQDEIDCPQHSALLLSVQDLNVERPRRTLLGLPRPASLSTSPSSSPGVSPGRFGTPESQSHSMRVPALSTLRSSPGDRPRSRLHQRRPTESVQESPQQQQQQQQQQKHQHEIGLQDLDTRSLSSEGSLEPM